jgi:TRAP-type C4-dicarboxylate transport system permease large subunit
MDYLGVLVLAVSFIVLLILGVPIAFSIGLAGILTMLVSIDSLPALTTYALSMARGLDSFPLLAIPFFILAGNIMNRGGIALRLINLARVLAGSATGGLAFVNVLANMLFGAISGSAAASASAIGSIMTPELKKEGYDPHFSAAVNISSATTGLSIPPSNVLIVYSLASGGVSITSLFLAGYIPGVLTGLAIILAAISMLHFRYSGLAGVARFLTGVLLLLFLVAGLFFLYRHTQSQWSTSMHRAVWWALAILPAAWLIVRSLRYRARVLEGFRRLLDAAPSLLLLIIVIGGIVAGFFTATEASAVAVLYTLVLAMGYREIKWRDIPGILLHSAKTTSVVMLLVATCMGLSWILAYENIPQTVSAGLLSVSDNPVIILLIINLILLVVGVFMDMTPAVLIFTPIFLPVVQAQLGLSPVHFGIIMVLNLSIGLCTPPVGSVLFIGCSVAGVKIDRVIRPLLPMFLAMLLVLLLVTYVPQIALWLPGLFGF